ncbi:MAG: glycerol-3-phosphate acyltransferase [Dehalococcoidales bacterium]
MNGFAAVITGYLLGSIPTAYLVARFGTGKDIRQIGGGNVGALNTFREISPAAGVLVMLIDMAKGALAIVLAYRVFDLSPVAVMLTGLACVIGHNWMVWLKFSGGKGMGAALGALAVLFPLYHYPWPGLIFAALIILPLIITRNVALSMGTGLFLLPVLAWFSTRDLVTAGLAVALLVIIGLKFLPTALEALKTSKSGKDFIFDHCKRPKNG